MIFSDPRGDVKNLNYLKATHYWHRPMGLFSEVIFKIKEMKVSSPTLLSGEYMELYVASLFGMGIETSQKTRCWIAKPPNDPPDFVFMTLSGEESNKIYFNAREVEVTRYRGNKKLLDVILAKDKAYPPDYILICFFEATEDIDMKDLYQSLLGKLNNIGHVFLIGHGIVGNKKPSINEMIEKISIIQLVPQYNITTVDLNSYFESIQKDNKKLVYVRNRDVHYGLREGDSGYPKVIIKK